MANNRKWSRETCEQIARGYSGLSLWKAGHPKSYVAAVAMGWHREIGAALGYEMTELWTYKKCLADARRFKTLNGWAKGGKQSYLAAHRHGFRERILAELPYMRQRKPNGYWTYERALAKAQEFKQVFDWLRGCSSSYTIARNKGWLVEIKAKVFPKRADKVLSTS